jgi:TP901 family phage tail tape measure protein
MPTDVSTLTVEVDSRSVRRGTTDLDDFGQQGTRTQTATERLTRSIKLMGAAVLAAGGVALIKVIQQHREFTKAISELSAITGATGDDLKFFREEAIAMGAASTFSANEVATAFKLIASAKPELLESKEALAAVTKEVLALSEASGLGLPEAAQALGGALNQFSEEASQASRFINVLAAGAKLGASEINDTSEAMRVSGAVAANMGLSFEETTATIQAMAAMSLKGSEAGTGLRGVLLKLANQSRDELNPEIVGIVQALKNLEGANLSTTEKTKLFGLESITAATALITQADEVDRLTGALRGTNVAYEQQALRVDNLDGDILRLYSSWSRAALVLGDDLDPALRKTTQLLTDIGDKIAMQIIEWSDLTDQLTFYARVVSSIAALDIDALTSAILLRSAQRALIDEQKNAILSGEFVSKEAAAAKKKRDEQAVIDEAATRARNEEIRAAAKKRSDERKAEERAREAAIVLVAQQKEDAELSAMFDEKVRLDGERILAAKLQAEEERELALQINRDFEEKKMQLTNEANELRIQSAKNVAAQVGSVEKTMFNNGVNLLRKLAGENKVIAAILIAIQTAKAVKDIQIQATSASAQVLAYGQVEAAAHSAMFNYPMAAAAIARSATAATAIATSATIATGLAIASGVVDFASIGSNSTVGSSGNTGNSVNSGSTSFTNNTIAPNPIEQTVAAPIVRELRVTVEGDGPHSEGMRKFAENLAETIKDMGGTTNLVIN